MSNMINTGGEQYTMPRSEQELKAIVDLLDEKAKTRLLYGGLTEPEVTQTFKALGLAFTNSSGMVNTWWLSAKGEAVKAYLQGETPAILVETFGPKELYL